MTARLLSFLNLVQDAIIRQNGTDIEGSRMVNFHKNIARFTMKDGGAIQVQAFILADGQTCVKVALYWAGINVPAVVPVYPTAENFSWEQSASKIGQLWIDGPIAAGINVMGDSDSNPALSKLMAVS
ncbi:MAG: hypothetical protein WC378_03820 [Opitutaceae bacterium]